MEIPALVSFMVGASGLSLGISLCVANGIAIYDGKRLLGLEPNLGTLVVALIFGGSLLILLDSLQVVPF